MQAGDGGSVLHTQAWRSRLVRNWWSESCLRHSASHIHHAPETDEAKRHKRISREQVISERCSGVEKQRGFDRRYYGGLKNVVGGVCCVCLFSLILLLVTTT